MADRELIDGRFDVLEPVATGGMGVVFRGRDEQTGELVALKLLASEDAIHVARARREIEVLARLSHPAIVRHVANGVMPDGSPYVAMEWVDGMTVADRIVEPGFTLREALAMIRPLADALASAHRAEIVHRDLKPSNILLSGNDPARPKLIDFGIARARDAVRSVTRTGATVGTPGYMSPEQARGERVLAPASDVFGLGCVLYECIAGKPAFSGKAAAAVMAKILFAEPAPLAAACPEAPREVLALVERMLDKHLGARLRDAAEVVAALDALAAVPEGPRRSSRRLTDDATQAPAAQLAAHCMVGAARGSPDDVLEPPTPEQLAQLAHAADVWQGHLEVVATGGVVVHLAGEPADASQRAAHVALAMRRILAGWQVAISSPRGDVAAAVETGSALLAKAAIAAIFRKASRETVTIDRGAARYLGDAFDVDLAGDLPQLRGERAK
ncbi:MAG: serine/threonine-protein kinase [Acidobacteriota bacterium]